jgi:hypothetical protein
MRPVVPERKGQRTCSADPENSCRSQGTAVTLATSRPRASPEQAGSFGLHKKPCVICFYFLKWSYCSAKPFPRSSSDFAKCSATASVSLTKYVTRFLSLATGLSLLHCAIFSAAVSMLSRELMNLRSFGRRRMSVRVLLPIPPARSTGNETR